MSVFTTENQTSAYAKDPSYYTGSGFVLGMLGYKKNGQKSLFGKIKDVALPVIGGIAGTVIGGPAGTKIGATIGQGLNAASTAAAKGIVGGEEDSLANVDEDMTNTLARGNLGISLGNVAGGVAGGLQAGDGIGKILKDVAPTINKDLPAIGSGLAGAIGANATTTYPIGKRVRYFATGGEVRPFTYTYAGQTFRIKQPRDYKVYDKNDHTEDLIITDKEGNHYGQMRIGERVQDQHSNLAMKAIMHSSVSEEKKKEALGELLHEELTSHEANDEEGEIMYQGGGDVKPRKSGATTVTTLNETRARAARMGNNSGKLAQLKADLASAQANLASTTNPAAKLRYQNNINAMQAEINAAAPPAAPKPAPAPVQTPVPAAPVKSSTPVTTNRPAVPNSVRRGTTAGSRPKVAAPPVTAQSRIAKMTHGQLVSTMGKVTTPEIITSNVPSAPESARPAVTPNVDKVASAIGVNTPAPATDYDPHPKVVADAPKSSVDNVGNLMDISRVVTGAVMASKKTPRYSLPARFTNWQSQVESKSNQGYSAPEMNMINGQIADNFSAGETALTNSVGSGATPGVVLAGLTRLNQQRAQQTQAAAVGDVARRAQNFAQYGTMANQDMNIDREQFDQRLAEVQSGQQAGVQLAQSGLQNLEQRKLYEDNYGSNSLYQKLMNKQVDKETEATNVLKRMRLAAVKNGTAAVE